MRWRPGRAYSQDLRERVLSAVDGGLRVRGSAPLFRVRVSPVSTALERRAATGATAPAARGDARRKVVLAWPLVRSRMMGRPSPSQAAWSLEFRPPLVLPRRRGKAPF